MNNGPRPAAAIAALNRRRLLGAAGLAAGGFAAAELARGGPALANHHSDGPNAVTGWHNVKAVDYDANGDINVDARADIQAAIDAVADAAPPTGGVVYLPPGIYPVSDPIEVRSRVTLLGAGVGATTVTKTDNDRGYSLIYLRNKSFNSAVQGASVASMTLDGRWTLPESEARGDGIAVWRQAIECHLADLWIKNVGSYAISFGNYGAQRCSCHRILMTDLGNEGVDVKNDNDENYGNVFETIWIERFGKSVEEAGDPPKPGEAGMDIRGPAILNDIVIRGFGDTAGAAGIRFRHGDVGDDNGLGGVESSLTNFYVDGGGQEAGHTEGVHIVSKRAVAVSNGTVERVGTGLEIRAAAQPPAPGEPPAPLVSRFHVVSNVHAHSCEIRGFSVRSGASHATLAHCSADACPIGFELEGNHNTLFVPRVHNAATGIAINAPADETDVFHPRYVSVGTPLYVDPDATHTEVIPNAGP